MKKAIILLLLVLIFPAIILAADVNSKTFPLSSEIYELMDDLYSLQGLARPSTSRPWSQAEAQLILSRIDENSLNETEKRLFSRIQDIISENLRWNFEDYGIGVKMDLALEGYLHSNDTEFVLDTDWVRGFEYRRPLAKLSMDFSVGSLFYTYCDIQYGYGRVTLHDTFVRLNPDHSAGGNMHVDILQGIPLAVFLIAEADMVKVDGTVLHFLHRVFGGYDIRLLVQHFHNALGGCPAHRDHQKGKGNHHQAG